MGNLFSDEYVYVVDEQNFAHFVQYRYFADLSGSYRSEIHLPQKSYCVEDFILTDEVETEGEYLPHVQDKEWKEFFSCGPSANAEFILTEAGYADMAISKIVCVFMNCSSSNMLEYFGYVVSAEGVQNLNEDTLDEAASYARDQSASPAEQANLMAQWIVEQL